MKLLINRRQSEIDIAAVADVKLVVSAPGLGDGIQAIKSGLLEIADCLMVNKSDLPGADATAEQLRNAVSLRGEGRAAVEVILTSATTQQGICQLVDVTEQLSALKTAGPLLERLRRRARYLIEQVATEQLRSMLRDNNSSSEVQDIVDELAVGETDPYQAACRLLRAAFGDSV